MKFQDPSMHGSKVTAGIKKRDEWKEQRATQNQYAPPTFSMLGA